MSGLLASAARSPSAASPFSSGAQATIPSIRGSSAETEVTQSASSRKSEKSTSACRKTIFSTFTPTHAFR